MNQKASIIVPCYNQATYLPQTLDSVIAQTYDDWECIVVNDGSSDNTEEVVGRYCKKDERIKYIYQPNSGVSIARNTGIAHAIGDYILPLDGDDLIASNYIDNAVAYFREHPLCKVVYCRVRKFGLDNYEWKLGKYDYDRLLWQNCLFCSAVYKREDYLRTSGYNPNMVNGWEDWDFWLSLLHRDDEVHQLDDVLFFYRTKKHSRDVSAKEWKSNLFRQVYENHKDLYADLEGRELELYAEMKYRELDVHDIRQSLSYRIGYGLTKPIRFIKKKLHKSE